MSIDTVLLPDLDVIHARLTSNAQERRLLRDILRLRVREQEWARRQEQATGPPAIACPLCGGPARYVGRRNRVDVYDCSTCLTGTFEVHAPEPARRAGGGS
jgi:hypothetical protein